VQVQTLTDRTKRICPSHEGGNNYWSASYSPRTKLIYIPSRPTCNEVTITPEQPRSPTGSLLGGRIRLLTPTESEIVVADPFTGEVKKRVRAPYPNFSAALTTAGGLAFTGLGDGTFIAYDDESMQELWKFNVGSGFNAPPMTFEVGGKQYVAIMSGLSQISKGRLTLTPELSEMRNQTMLFVFAL
jgi:alcohol dehydrogenase (cytochrome c)